MRDADAAERQHDFCATTLWPPSLHPVLGGTFSLTQRIEGSPAGGLGPSLSTTDPARVSAGSKGMPEPILARAA
jgi:hypothetical protein